MEKKQIYFIVNGTETTVEMTGKENLDLLAQRALEQVGVSRPVYDFQVIHNAERTLSFKMSPDEQNVKGEDVIFLSLRAGTGASVNTKRVKKEIDVDINYLL